MSTGGIGPSARIVNRADGVRKGQEIPLMLLEVRVTAIKVYK